MKASNYVQAVITLRISIAQELRKNLVKRKTGNR